MFMYSAVIYKITFKDKDMYIVNTRNKTIHWCCLFI